MKKVEYKKQERITYLLDRMSKEPMSIHQMADAVNMGMKSVSKYLTELRFKKKVHIAKYDRTSIGAYTVYYMTGDLPDAVKPVPLSQKEYNERYRAKSNKPSRSKSAIHTKFVPRPDYAAHWLFNSIGEQNA